MIIIFGLSGSVLPEVDFDGTDDIATVPDNDDIDFDTTDSFSISIWARPGSINQDAEIIEKQSGNPLYQILAQPADGGNVWSSYIRGSNGNLCTCLGTTTIVAGTDYHIVLIRDVPNDQVRLYINGGSAEDTEIDTTTSSLATAVPLNIGHGTSGAFDGALAELYIWKGIVLTQVEIDLLAKSKIKGIGKIREV